MSATSRPAADRMRVLLTCPPMLGMADEFRPAFAARAIALDCPDVVQTLPESRLIELVPEYDGWIIGDDPATERVFVAGRAGRLRAAVKWGVGVDNVAVDAARRLGIQVCNTPGLFGREVADIATGYVIALARGTFEIDRGVRRGEWPKPCGMSLYGKQAGLVGFGDIGRNTAVRLLAAGLRIAAYDPAGHGRAAAGVEWHRWPERIGDLDFLIFTCSLNEDNAHMFNHDVLRQCKPGVRIVNVSRGGLIDESALVDGLRSGRVHSAALDVMEREPLPPDAPLRGVQDRCIFGSHNASNTAEAVRTASETAMQEMFRMLGAA